MPKLPGNLVKPPAFDNPVRRTAPAHTAFAELPAIAQQATPEATQLPAHATETDEAIPGRGGVVIPMATSAQTVDQPEPDGAPPMSHRITVRVEDTTRRALEAECFKRRMAGEKTNVAEIARSILKNWASRSSRASRVE